MGCPSTVEGTKPQNAILVQIWALISIKYQSTKWFQAYELCWVTTETQEIENVISRPILGSKYNLVYFQCKMWPPEGKSIIFQVKKKRKKKYLRDPIWTGSPDPKSDTLPTELDGKRKFCPKISYICISNNYWKKFEKKNFIHLYQKLIEMD